jgi:hypothetical protein
MKYSLDARLAFARKSSVIFQRPASNSRFRRSDPQSFVFGPLPAYACLFKKRLIRGIRFAPFPRWQSIGMPLRLGADVVWYACRVLKIAHDDSGCCHRVYRVWSYLLCLCARRHEYLWRISAYLSSGMPRLVSHDNLGKTP